MLPAGLTELLALKAARVQDRAVQAVADRTAASMVNHLQAKANGKPIREELPPDGTALTVDAENTEIDLLSENLRLFGL